MSDTTQQQMRTVYERWGQALTAIHTSGLSRHDIGWGGKDIRAWSYWQIMPTVSRAIIDAGLTIRVETEPAQHVGKSWITHAAVWVVGPDGAEILIATATGEVGSQFGATGAATSAVRHALVLGCMIADPDPAHDQLRDQQARYDTPPPQQQQQPQRKHQSNRRGQRQPGEARQEQISMSARATMISQKHHLLMTIAAWTDQQTAREIAAAVWDAGDSPVSGERLKEMESEGIDIATEDVAIVPEHRS